MDLTAEEGVCRFKDKAEQQKQSVVNNRERKKLS